VVQVQCDEGVANYIGPKPCAGVCEVVGEASVGERAGQPLSRERKLFLGAEAVCVAEGKTLECAISGISQPQAPVEATLTARAV